MGGESEREREREREGGREKSYYGLQKRGGGRTWTEEEGSRFVLQRPNVSTRCLGEKKRGGCLVGSLVRVLFFSSPYCKIRRHPPAPTKTLFSQCFLFGNFILLSKWRSFTGRFSQICFFLAILYYCQNGDHPQEDLARFG